MLIVPRKDSGPLAISIYFIYVVTLIKYFFVLSFFFIFSLNKIKLLQVNNFSLHEHLLIR